MLADRLGVSVAAVVLGAVGVAAAAAGGWWALRTPPGPDVAEILPSAHAVPIPTPAPAVAPEPVIVVHVDGAVARPGVHELPAGSRVADALDAAGGLTGDADGARLNLAEPMSDGSRLWVPSAGEEREPSVVRATPAATPAGGGQTGAAAVPVDINTADAAALESLPGIGPALAGAIIEHRDRVGTFLRVDDLERVSGIGPAKLEQIRPLVSV